jgi:hypothetical protein
MGIWIYYKKGCKITKRGQSDYVTEKTNIEIKEVLVTKHTFLYNLRKKEVV